MSPILVSAATTKKQIASHPMFEYFPTSSISDQHTLESSQSPSFNHLGPLSPSCIHMKNGRILQAKTNRAPEPNAPRRRMLGSISGNRAPRAKQEIMPSCNPLSNPPFFQSSGDIGVIRKDRSNGSNTSKKPRIPTTDPQRTALLWQRVM